MATALSHYQQSWQVPQPGCRIALVGFGTVGKSVARLLLARHDDHSLRLTHVCNRHVARKKVNWVAPDVAWTDDMQEVVQSGADVVVELMGGLEPAHQLVRRALQAGKSVVTANKQLIAKYGPELQQLASDNGQYLGFGACVAGGVPVLSGLHDGLAGDRIFRIRGILNGTCNYILTRMEEARIAFDSALAEAQCAGFAEADPTDDIDGLDAGAKLAILARVGLQADATLEQVICRSIREIKAIDFDYARELGCTIRQISTAILRDEKIYLAVEPSLVPLDSVLAKVVGSQNLVVSSGKFGGDTVFGGCGAGGDPTAVAVVSDLLQAAHFRSSAEFGPRRVRTALREVTRDIEAPQYLRFVVRDRPGIIAALSSALARYDINLDAVVQKPGHSKAELPFVITLDSCAAAQLHAALTEISRFDFLVEAPVRMPLLKIGA
jgi:homoserine dehydrogenase